MPNPQTQLPLETLIPLLKAPANTCKINIRCSQPQHKIAVDLEGNSAEVLEAALECVHAILNRQTPPA